MKVRITIDKITVVCAEDLFEIMQRILKRERKVDRMKEHFWVLALNSANKILNIELVALGNYNRVHARPADILSMPLQKQAAGVVLVHNHPSGVLNPSEADKDVTDKMIQACRLMNTPVLDHVIITEHSFYSFKERGVLEVLESSNKYVLPYELEKQYYKEMQAAIREVKAASRKKVKDSLEKGEAKGLKKGKAEGLKEGEAKGLEKGEARGIEKGMEAAMRRVASQMLAQGQALPTIQALTGLSEQVISQLAKTKK